MSKINHREKERVIEALERLADANAEAIALQRSRVLTDQGPQHRILYVEVIARDVLPTRSGPPAAMVREAFELGELFVAEAMRRNPPPGVARDDAETAAKLETLQSIVDEMLDQTCNECDGLPPHQVRDHGDTAIQRLLLKR